ncbi:MAG: peptide-methionine (S)-S-oxide reductase MsrA, partial [Oscillospiraceae bacterium]|nr:peptide-methionine (S)-S-oxide reductase MsrA [Oscillospiraceae bacterium]
MISLLLAVLILSSGCGFGSSAIGDDSMLSYYRISQDEARAMMAENDGHVIVDVRRQDEYDSGHIPGAICIPNETIGTEPPEELPDPEQIILVYCRSGNRSSQAAQKLFDMGYTAVYEFGGITSWTGEVVTEEPVAGEEKRTEAENMKTIYLAGGCFWGLQKFFDQFDGVLSTEVGYANGPDSSPSYEDVCRSSGHAETVRVGYDPERISLTALLEYYFMVIDPLSVNRQGNDRGIQYRTGIYYTDESQL